MTKKKTKAVAKRPARARAATSEGARATLSARQEKFAVLYASGKTQIESYTTAYGPAKGAEASASRLLSSAKIQARVEALQKEAAASCVLTLAEKRAFLRRVVLTPIGEVDASSALCQAAEYSESGRKFKMPCKLRAIELDAKLAGELRENALQVDASGDVNVFVMTPERMKEFQARRARALGQ